MSAVNVSEIIGAATVAWSLYRMGWDEDLDGSRQYQEFGNDIRAFAENLNNISRVVENAKTTWTQQSFRFRGPAAVQKDWNLSSLREIIGDYNRTLADCRKLLEENHEFRKNRSFAYNIEWNLVIQPKVDQLRKRLDSHNSKICILLKPLELTLLSDIHHDLAERIDAVHQSILHLQGLLIRDVEQALSEQGHTIPITLLVPADIEKKFQAAAENSKPEMRTPGSFPLQAGADAFVLHFKESTKTFIAGNFLNERTPSRKQYLSLLKCIWIIRYLQASNVLKDAPQDSQWPGYVNQLNEDLSMECQRFTAPSAQRLIAPDLSMPRHIDEYNIWPVEDIAEYISPHFEVHMEEVLKIPMPSPSESLQRDMTVYKLESTKYRLVESVEDKNAPLTRREEFKMDIDLKTVNLMPIYATPSSRPKSSQVLIHSASTHTNPTFQELKQVLRLQHLLTGYKVYERYDQSMVTVSFFISDQTTPIEEHGRLQLWLPRPFGDSSASNSRIPSAAQSLAGSSRASATVATDSITTSNDREEISPTRPNSRNSTIFGPSSRSNHSTHSLGTNPTWPTTPATSRTTSRTNSFSPTLNPNLSRTSLGLPISSASLSSRHRPPSTHSDFSYTSHSTVTSTTTISTGGAGRAHLHAKPAKPLLVLFLKSRDAAAQLAIAAVQIDDLTAVQRERCRCRTSHSQCRVSCVERAGGCLLVQRWDADRGLGSWDLARVGMEQRKELPADAWHDVKRVSLKFASLEDRYKFAGRPCSCKPTMLHDLSRCILQGHHGIFGTVKQIGCQKLRNYHEERDKAAGRNMVLGLLPEDEI